MGQCLSKNRDSNTIVVGQPQLPPHGTPNINNGQASNHQQSQQHQITLQATPNFYHPQNSFNSQSVLLNSSSLLSDSSRGGREKNFDGDQVIALYPYESRTDGDLTIQKGDIMFLLESKDRDWWFVRHAKDGRTGYVPRNFVALRKNIESEEWFAGAIPRLRAERLVLSSGMPIGTYLIRERDVMPKEYALTIKDGNSTVKHYKIKQLDNGEGFFITSRMKFHSLKQLVKYYSDTPDGLCHRLTFPAPRIAPARPDLSSETQHSWEIPRHELQLVEKLGSGNFGDVWKGTWRGNVTVAIKTMKPGTMSNEAFLGEAAIMKKCDHQNLVKLYAVCTQDEPFYIIVEYMPNGSLLTYLRDERNVLSLQALVDMASQVANGMTYLEERRLVHRDLAARNVLVGDKISGVPLVKVADFGLARALMEEDVYEAQFGAKFPIKWTSPEAALNGNFTVKSDVWSYGVLLYELMSRGCTPYPAMPNREVLEQVQRGYRMSKPTNCPAELYTDVMLKCWNADPLARPTFVWLYAYLDDFFVASQGAYLPPQ